MSLLGGEYAARFPNAVVGIVTLLSLYLIGRREASQQLGSSGQCYMGAPYYHTSTSSQGSLTLGSICLFSGGIYGAHRYFQAGGKEARYWLLASAASIGASMLTKGPVGLLIFGLVGIVFLVLRSRFWRKVRLGPILIFLLGFGIVGGSWFLWQILDGRGEVVQDFITYQIRLLQTEDAGHRGFFGYHAVVLLLGVFPASPLALKPLFSRTRDTDRKGDWTRLMKITFWVILILFSSYRPRSSTILLWPISRSPIWERWC